MPKHRSESSRQHRSVRGAIGSPSDQPRHRAPGAHRPRRWMLGAVVVAVLAAGTFAGLAIRGAAAGPAGEASVAFGHASPGVSVTTAAELGERERQSSRGGSRILITEKRQLLAAQAKAQAQARAQARTEARADARAERAERQRKRVQRAAERAQRAAEREARAWRAPLTGYRVTATFGQSSSLWSTVHTGVDLAAPSGVPVTSIASGTVTFAGYDGAYGNKVVVQHQDGTETWYAHLASISVSVGQSVTHHSVVGPVGSTGNVTGPHFHLEARPVGGDPVDPLTALAARGGRL